MPVEGRTAPWFKEGTMMNAWTPRDLTKIAALSGRHIKTVRRWNRGEDIRDACRDDIERAAALLRSPAKAGEISAAIATPRVA